MRRNMMVSLVGMVALVAGCGMFSAHSDVIEEAAGQQFTAEHLASIMTSVKGPMQYDVKTGEVITHLWTDMTLFAQAAATGKLKTDSALVADAMWPTIVQATAARWMDTVVAQKSKVPDASVDSAYKADQVRAVQHILVRVDSSAPKEDKDAARKRADHFLSMIKSGYSFAQLAYDSTMDDGSKADSGWYGLAPKARWDPPFGNALWKLKPGEVSPIVQGRFGFHIIRRPSDAESVKLWRDSLTRASAGPIQAAYMAQVTTANDVKVDASAVPHMRAALDDLDGHRDDHTALTTYKDGSFTTGDFVHWVLAITADPATGPDQITKFKSAPDSQYVGLVKEFTQLQLVVREADRHHVHLTAAEWKQMETGFATDVDSIKAAIGLTPAVLDPKASEHDRTRAAQLKVDEFFDNLAAQKPGTHFRPLPGLLAATLRVHLPTKFNAIALQHGLDLARSKHSADSAKANPSGAGGAAPPPAPGLRPAPGGPPVGNPPPPPAPAPKKP
ncbi:MAG: peptidylprolyl isomerase [Gemmatimonadales bacterium]